MNRWMVAVLCGSIAAGCGASSSDPQVTIDSGVNGSADTGNSTSTDHGSTTSTDRGSTTSTDRGSTTTDTGTASAYGVCGTQLHTDLCACGMTASCQQTAQMNAFARSSACQTCYGNALVGCCPDQAQAIQDCATAAHCTDQACAQTMCASQFTALQTCFQTNATSNAACMGMLQTCFGPGFPQIDCSM